MGLLSLRHWLMLTLMYGRNQGLGDLEPLAQELARLSRRGNARTLKAFARDVADQLGMKYSATTTQNYMSQIKMLAQRYGADLTELEGYEGPGTAMWPRLREHRRRRGVPFGYPPWVRPHPPPGDYRDDDGDDNGGDNGDDEDQQEDERPPPRRRRHRQAAPAGVLRRLRSTLKRTRSGKIYGRGRRKRH